MENQIGDWLVDEFVVLGIPLQNWMLIAAVIILFEALIILAPDPRRDSN